MVYFIASEFYNIITTSITSVEGEFIAGSKVEMKCL